MVKRVSIDIPDPRRIYCVVAETVQGNDVSTVQPKGRMAAQHGHAVSKVRHKMLQREIVRAMRLKGRKTKLWMRSNILFFKPITTIMLACRDSKELHHVRNLLAKAQINHEVFVDDNPEYGKGRATTAVATWPVLPEEVEGITDYLPLALKEE